MSLLRNYFICVQNISKIPVCLLNSTELIDNSGNWKCKMQIRECTSDLIFIYPYHTYNAIEKLESSSSPPIEDQVGYMQNSYGQNA